MLEEEKEEKYLSSHRDLGSVVDLLLEFLREDGREVDLGAAADAKELDGACVQKVVGDDLGELRKVPAVPLLGAHTVGVELLVEIVEEADGLDDHGVDLIGAELDLEAGQTVSKTKGHGLEIRGLEAGDEVGHLRTETTDELINTSRVGGVDAELLLDGASELAVDDTELVLESLGDDGLLEELGQTLSNLVVVESRGSSDGLVGSLELVELLELDTVPSPRFFFFSFW